MSDLTRPGVVPLRPLTTGELLDGAVAVLRTRPGALIGLGVLFAVLEQVALYPLRSLADLDITLLPATGRLPQYALMLLAGVVTEAMVIAALAAIAAGHGGTLLLGRFAPPRPRLNRAAVAGVVAVVGVGSGVVPGGLLSLAAPAAVIERRGIGSALLRSLRLASRDFLRAMWIRMLGQLSWVLVRVGLIVAVVLLFIGPWGGLPPSSTWDRVVLAAAAVVVNAVAYPVLACLDVMLLLEGRMRTEGLDISVRWALRREVAPSLEAPR